MSGNGAIGRIVAATLTVFAFIGFFTHSTQAASCPSAGIVMNAGNAFMGAARSASVGAFASALSRTTDVRAVALSALGQYRKQLPAGRQGEYVQNARSYMARFLLDHAGPFRSSRDLTIEKCNGNIVETSLGGRSRMVWRLSSGRIRDVRVSGVWLAIQLRSKFTEIIRRNDGDVGALLAYLRR
jgi:phospholipid transport system substrate-binding protein